MPRIDDPKLKKKPFIKKTMRAWDKDLFSKLKLDHTDDESPELNKYVEASNQLNQDTEHKRKEFEPDQEQLAELKENITVQSGGNQGSIRIQGLDKSKVESKAVPNSLLMDEQDINNRIGKLSGLEQRVFFLVHDICIDRKNINTGYVKSIHFDRAIAANRNSRETAVKRLVKKGLLQRNKGKSGADGTLNFSINEIIMGEALRFVNNQGKYDVFSNKVDKSYPDYKRNVKHEEEALVD
jgi:hypothetical protein